ncbi:hypothetical protein DVH24_036324, partial [Malus domestica]
WLANLSLFIPEIVFSYLGHYYISFVVSGVVSGGVVVRIVGESIGYRGRICVVRRMNGNRTHIILESDVLQVVQALGTLHGGSSSTDLLIEDIQVSLSALTLPRSTTSVDPPMLRHIEWLS